MYLYLKNDHHVAVWRRFKATQSPFFVASIAPSFKFKTNDTVMRIAQIKMCPISRPLFCSKQEKRKGKSNKINKIHALAFWSHNFLFPLSFFFFEQKRGLEIGHILICAKRITVSVLNLKLGAIDTTRNGDCVALKRRHSATW